MDFLYCLRHSEFFAYSLSMPDLPCLMKCTQSPRFDTSYSLKSVEVATKGSTTNRNDLPDRKSAWESQHYDSSPSHRRRPFRSGTSRIQNCQGTPADGRGRPDRAVISISCTPPLGELTANTAVWDVCHHDVFIRPHEWQPAAGPTPSRAPPRAVEAQPRCPFGVAHVN